MTPPDSLLLRRGGLSLLLSRRAAVAALAAGAALAAAVVASVAVGGTTLTPGEAVAALLGRAGRGPTLIVEQVRLPRAVAGVLAGAGLGAAGCLTQTLARNRLATPDLLGVDNGATLAVLGTLAGSTTGVLGAWWAGPLGAMAAAAVVVLAAGGLGTRGHRVIVVGIGVSALLGALTELALSRQDLAHAGAVYAWSTGSLAGRGYAVAVPVALGLALLLPAVLLAGRGLRLLRLDPDAAASLGLDLRRARLGVLLCAVLLAGLAVGVGGPIGFVALSAPILASRLTGPEQVPIGTSALLGAALVVTADTLARVAGPTEVPVGVVTALLGGPFLLWVLLSDREER